MAERRIRVWETALVGGAVAFGAAEVGLQLQPGEGLDLAVPALLVIGLVVAVLAGVVMVKVFGLAPSRFTLLPVQVAIVYVAALVGSAPCAHTLNRGLDTSPRVERHGVGVSASKEKTGWFSDVRHTDGPRAGQVVRIPGHFEAGAAATFVTRRGRFGWEWREEG